MGPIAQFYNYCHHKAVFFVGNELKCEFELKNHAPIRTSIIINDFQINFMFIITTPAKQFSDIMVYK